MQRYKVFLADDDPASRRRLRRLLLFEPDCDVSGECASGLEAVAVLARQEIDILFLNVQMPEMDGFQVVNAVSPSRPLIIFTSACDDSALKAFDVHAFDYLLKPFHRQRLHQSVQRACAQLAKTHDRMPARPSPDRIAIRNNGRIFFLRLGEIDWIEASDNYVCLHCGKETHTLRETMAELEARLDPSRFIRVHRSAIVNLDRVRELQPWFRGDYRVVLQDGTELTLTKNHRENLESALLLGA
jgi:two-component system LytT family response regulator